MTRRAIVMAGGKGSRLAPLTTNLPKPLVPLGDRPILDLVLRQLTEHNFARATISIGHLGSIIEAWVQASAEYPIDIDFIREEMPLGTAGALKKLPEGTGSILALNGDILTNLDFGRFLDKHAASGAIATVAVTDRVVDIPYGVVHMADDGCISSWEEKPTLSVLVSMGVYAFDSRLRDLIDDGETVDFPTVLERAIAVGESVRTEYFQGYWRDIGNHSDYLAAVAEIEQGLIPGITIYT